MCEDNLEVITNASTEHKDNDEDDKDDEASKSKKQSEKKRDPFAEKMSRAFSRAHRYVDGILAYGKDERSRVRWSGVSTLACVIHSKKTLEKDLPTDEEDDDAEKKVFGGALKNETESVPKVEKQPTDTAKEEGKEATERETPEKVDPPIELGTIHIANAGNAVIVSWDKHFFLFLCIHVLIDTKSIKINGVKYMKKMFVCFQAMWKLF
jgi:hypothetical protein